METARAARGERSDEVIRLQLIERGIQLLAKRYAVELVLHSAVKSLADAIGLRGFHSGVPGRDRWAVPAIAGNPKQALALETLLRSEPGVRRASANELTGRVLVEYVPNELQQPIEQLIRRALAFGPMSSFEFEALDPQSTSFETSPVKLLIAAELGCLFLKFAFASVICPGLGTAAGIGFTFASLLRSSRMLKKGFRTRVGESYQK